jgi:integrase
MSELPAFLRKLRNDRGRGDTTAQLGLRLLLLTGVRTGELRSATPEQFELERGLWIIQPVIVKQLQESLRLEDNDIPPYIVPLSLQAIAIVRQLLDAKRPAIALLHDIQIFAGYVRLLMFVAYDHQVYDLSPASASNYWCLVEQEITFSVEVLLVFRR